MLKTIDRNMEVGKFRTQIEGKAQSVSLKGLRNRYHPLRKMELHEFESRISLDPLGNIRDDHVIRGTPNAWIQRGVQVFLWPFPVHSWSIRIETETKDKPERTDE